MKDKQITEEEINKKIDKETTELMKLLDMIEDDVLEVLRMVENECNPEDTAAYIRENLLID